MSELRTPFGYQRELMKQAADDAESLRAGLAAEREAMPELQRECTTRIFPLFRNWSHDLRKANQPVKVRDLRRRAKSLRGLMALVLTNRKAMSVLFGNVMLRLAILLVFLVKLGLLIGIIWGAVRLAEWLSEVF